MSETGIALRQAARTGFEGPTAGHAPGFVQAHLLVVPAAIAKDLVGFCDANPVACPLLAVGAKGDPRLTTLGNDIDARTDLPGYVIHRDGLTMPVPHLLDAWRPDWVAVAIGCWDGAEAAIARAGIRQRRTALGAREPLYRSWIPAVTAGRFGGSLVVTMRPFAQEDVRRVASITGRLPRNHDAPIHRGHPAHLGILDLAEPDWGEALMPRSGEECLFWGHAMTAVEAMQAAKLPLFVTNAPGCLLVTDLPEEKPRWH
jgi:uncharacterized protein YcsI (UPF0317 family)